MISSWILGAVIYVGGAGLIVLGENLIKRSQEAPPVEYGAYRIWLLGGAGFLTGNALHFVAFMFAAQSMLEALGSSVLLWNLFFARVVNNEEICSEHLVATAVIIGGASISLVWGPHGSNAHTLDQMQSLLLRPQFVLYEASLAAIVGCLQVTPIWYNRPADHLHMVSQVAYNLLEARQAIMKREYAEGTSVVTPAETQLLALSFAGVSAGIGSHSVILSKCMAEALRSWANGQGTAVGITAVVMVCAWVSVTAFWLYRLNSALARFPALFIVPTLHAIWMCCSILGGAIFFDEFHSFSVWDTVLFGAGVLTVLVGVALMPVSQEGSSSSLVQLSEVNITRDDVPLLCSELGPAGLNLHVEGPSAASPAAHKETNCIPTKCPEKGLFDRARAAIARKCASSDKCVRFAVSFKFKHGSVQPTTNFDVDLPLSLTVGEFLWWLGDPELAREQKPQFEFPGSIDMEGMSRWLDWSMTSSHFEQRDQLGLTLMELGVRAGHALEVQHPIIAMNCPSCYSPWTVQARESWVQELDWEPPRGKVPLVLLLAASGQSAGGFPGDPAQQRPEWLLQFVREHQAHGVVARLILIDPDFYPGQGTPEWEMTSSEGSMFYYGQEFAAVERFRHAELPIEAIVIRCACLSYGRGRFDPLLDFLHGSGNRADDFCTLGDGESFIRFTARIEAAGGLVQHSSLVPESIGKALVPETIELVDGRIVASWSTREPGRRMHKRPSFADRTTLQM